VSLEEPGQYRLDGGEEGDHAGGCSAAGVDEEGLRDPADALGCWTIAQHDTGRDRGPISSRGFLGIGHPAGNLLGGIVTNPFCTFMASMAGRIIRIVVGIILIVWGLFGLHGALGIVVAVVGAVPLLAGLFDVCIFAPLFGCPLSGPKTRTGK